MKVYRILSIPYMCDGSRTYLFEYDTDEFKENWRELWLKIAKVLEVLGDYINRKGEIISDSDKLSLAVDLIVWSLRAPVFLDTIDNVIYSPYKLYIYDRLSKYMVEENLEEFMNKCNPADPVIKEFKNVDECLLMKDLFLKKIGERGKEGVYSDLEKYYLKEKEINGVKTRNWIYLLSYPADTRPGYNTTSLIVHSILVSALSWALVYSRTGDNVKALEHALAGLLHDLGKPIDPRNHVEKTVEFIKEILGDILRKIIGEEHYNNVLTLIKKHHEKDTIIGEADRLAAGERNIELIKRFLLQELQSVLRKIRDQVGEELREYVDKAIDNPLILYKYVEDVGYSKSKWSKLTWDLWCILTENNLVKELSGTFAKKIWEIDKIDVMEEIKYSDEISAILIDIRGIQNTIKRSLDLRIMSVSSYLIDYWLISYLPVRVSEWSLFKYGFATPLSAFLLNSGGKALMIFPSRLIDQLIDSIKTKLNTMSDKGLRLSIAIAKSGFTSVYSILIDILDKKVFAVKSLDQSKEVMLHPGIGSRCELCGIKPASLVISFGEETRKVCIECYIKWNIASKLVYGIHKLRSRIKGVEIKELLTKYLDDSYEKKDIMDLLIEQIAGLPLDKTLYGRLLNYSVINIDGNLMGYYMGRSKSFTEAIEKSYRIDYALKISLRDFIGLAIETISGYISKEFEGDVETIGKREVARLYLGILYAGGDDAKILAPSYLAIPLTLYLLYKFNKELGCTASLSVGIASGPPKHHVWGLDDASHSLMEMCKEGMGRLQAASLIRGETVHGVGSLNIYFTESTSMLTSSRMKSFYTHDLVKEISSKTLYLGTGNEHHYDILYLIKELLDIKKYNDIDSFIAYLIITGYTSIMKQCTKLETGKAVKCIRYYLGKDVGLDEYENVEGKIKSYTDKLEDIREIVREILGVYDRFGRDKTGLYAAILYAKRQSTRDVKGREVYRKIAKILSLALSNDQSPPLVNIDMIIKTLGGGAL